MKSISLLLCFIMTIFASEYHALSKGDRKSLDENYIAIKKAFEDKNFDVIIKFGPEMLIKYESVLLDPEKASIRLRPSYCMIDTLYRASIREKKADSLGIIAGNYLKTGDFSSSAVIYDRIVDMHSDGLSQYQKVLDSVVQIIKKDRTLESYHVLVTLHNVGAGAMREYEEMMKGQLQSRIAEISATMDVDSIEKFVNDYPGVQKEDVTQMLDMARMEKRMSIIRHPSIDAYKDYMGHFGADGGIETALEKKVFEISIMTPVVDISPVEDVIKELPNSAKKIKGDFEEFLYVKWQQETKNKALAMSNYLKAFPQGKYSEVVSVKEAHQEDTAVKN